MFSLVSKFDHRRSGSISQCPASASCSQKMFSCVIQARPSFERNKRAARPPVQRLETVSVAHMPAWGLVSRPGRSACSLTMASGVGFIHHWRNHAHSCKGLIGHRPGQNRVLQMPVSTASNEGGGA